VARLVSTTGRTLATLALLLAAGPGLAETSAEPTSEPSAGPTSEGMPEAVGEVIPEAVSEVVPDEIPAVMPAAIPQMAREVTLLASAGPTPEASPGSSPEATREAIAEATRHDTAAPLPCPEPGDMVAVITTKRELWLCRDGALWARFQVALGQGGLDKRRKGDRRTPLGTYALRSPRPSGRFGVFIPIGYPTAEQAAQGLTGGTLGIHGPPRGKAEPEYPTTAFDWTLGCVATGTDADIEVIADFVRQRQPVVVIR
jgi:hypothetical protein